MEVGEVGEERKCWICDSVVTQVEVGEQRWETCWNMRHTIVTEVQRSERLDITGGD